MNRRSLLLGAVAVPAGILLPKAIAEELALPPPEIKPGDNLVIINERIKLGTFIRYSDLLYGSAGVTLLHDDGSVMGTFFAQRWEHRIDPYEVQFLHSGETRAFPGPVSIDLTLRRIA